jgi:hypothetical protein
VEHEEAWRILAVFEREGVRYVLVGSVALAAQGIVRGTRDMDFFIAPDPDNVARLRAALKSLYGGDPNVDEITSEDLMGPYPAIEYTPPHGLYSMDILARLGEAFRFEDLESEDLIVNGVKVHVATPRTLYRMKRNTVRPQDRLDAQTLRERFGLPEDA